MSAAAMPGGGASQVFRRLGGMLRRLPWISGPLALAFAAAILAFWLTNLDGLLGDTAPVVSLERTVIRLAPGASVTIGNRELMQGQSGASGERAHVAISHGAGGAVSIRNVARAKRLWIDGPAGGSYSARWRLETGDVIASAAFTLRVVRQAPGRAELTLRAGQAEQRLDIAFGADGGRVLINGAAPEICADASAVDRLRATIKGYLASDSRGENRLIDLGGALTCQVRDEVFLAAPAAPFRAFSLVTRAGELFLAPGELAAGPRPPVQFRRGGRVVADFADIDWALSADPAAPSHIIVGRTRYRADLAFEGRDRVVTLAPVSKLHRMTVAEADEALRDLAQPGVTITPTPPRLPFSRAEMPQVLIDLAMPERLVRLALVAGLCLLGLIGALWRIRQSRGWGAVSALPAAIISLGLVGLSAALALSPELSQLLGRPLAWRDTMTATIAGYGLASLLIVLTPAFALPARIAWLAVIGLIAMGNLTLISLAVDSPRTDFAVHVHKNKLMFVDIVPVMAMVMATMPAAMAASWPRSFFAGGRAVDAIGRMLPAALLVGGLLAWGILGTETGVGGFQPVELGKIALVLLLAHVFAGFMRIDVFYAQRQYLLWLGGAVLSALVFLFFLTAIPFLKSDYSPILIILVTFVALAFSFLGPGVAQRIGAVLGTLRRRRAAPQARARARSLGLPRGAALAMTLLVLLILNLGLIAAFPALASKVITGAWSIPSERMAAIDLLEKARGGPLRVPAERLLTWFDLDHSNPVIPGAATPVAGEPPAPRPPDVLHRDLGLQLLYSKLALAQAPCALSRLTLPSTASLPDAAAALWRANIGAEPAAGLCALLPDWPREPVADRDEASPGAEARFTVRDLLRVPVIQNDFIATYVLVRFGLPAAVAILALQFTFVVALVFLALGLRLKPGIGFQDEAARTGLSIIAAGVATLFAVHWMISWGNAIGLLPVMGQPMTLIAAATSHHLLMALPAILLMLVAGRVHASRTTPVNRAPPAW